jgi:prepilin-type processing-associated H-X9-DG protein
MLIPYMKSTQILQCPSESTGPVADPATPAGYSDYFYNANLGRGPGNSMNGTDGVSDASITAPVVTLINGDEVTANARSVLPGTGAAPACAVTTSAAATGNSQYGTSTSATSDDGPANMSTVSKQRHLDGANYSFVDGHVKWYSKDKVANACTSPDLNVPTFAYR